MKAKVKDTTRGCHYVQQNCKHCQKLIVGQSEESRKGARVDLWRRMKQHGKEFHPEIETETKGADHG